MVRLARAADGAVRVGRNEPGRGAWLCAASPECFDLAVKRRAINRAVRSELSDMDLEALRVRLGALAPGRQSSSGTKR